MATIVNTPPPRQETNTGFLLGIILLIIFFALLITYGLPLLRSTFQGPQITVPSQIDVNIHRTK